MTITPSSSTFPSGAPLTGLGALVTGGSRGTGRAVATRLAADGAAVALTYNRQRAAEDLVAGIADQGGSAYAVQLDLADPTGFEQTFTAADAAFAGAPAEALDGAATVTAASPNPAEPESAISVAEGSEVTHVLRGLVHRGVLSEKQGDPQWTDSPSSC